jgi:DNA-3-methyladenine glycosylase I
MRCWGGEDPLMSAYHDEEWGVPLHDDRKLFEFLVLEGFQAGLSWATVLRKRENFRTAFDGFDPEKIARYGSRQFKRLLSDAGIIRNRLKIAAAISNAQRFLEIQEEFGSFDSYIWSFLDGKPIKHAFRSLSQLPAKTKEAESMSRELRRRGFKFVGPTIWYAHMQATGMVNDHLVQCFRYHQVCPPMGGSAS